MKQRLVLFTTGGTIEKSYNEIEGHLEVSHYLIKHYALDPLRLPFTQIELLPLMAKDSLFMDDEDRKLVAQMIGRKQQETPAPPIVVVHGTDTMEITATFCLEQLKGRLKSAVVFTGAMKPVGFVDSDGRQNIAEALLAAKIMPPGIYISFHNEVYPVPNVTKNHQLGTFYFKNPPEKGKTSP